jgi:hypothetical protein
MPMVGMWALLNGLSTKRHNKDVLPAPESPINSIFMMWSHLEVPVTGGELDIDGAKNNKTMPSCQELQYNA